MTHKWCSIFRKARRFFFTTIRGTSTISFSSVITNRSHDLQWTGDEGWFTPKPISFEANKSAIPHSQNVPTSVGGVTPWFSFLSPTKNRCRLAKAASDVLAAKETPTRPWMPLFWGNNQDSFTTFFSTIWVGHQLLHSSKVPYYPQPKSCSHQGGEIGATMVGRTPVAWSHNSAETPVSWKLPAEKHKFQAKTRADLKWSQGESRRRPKQKKGQEKWECFHPNEGPDHPVGNSKLLTLAISVWAFLIAAAGSTFPKNTLFHIQVPYSKTHRPPKIFQLETYELRAETSPRGFSPHPHGETPSRFVAPAYQRHLSSPRGSHTWAKPYFVPQSDEWNSPTKWGCHIGIL